MCIVGVVGKQLYTVLYLYLMVNCRMRTGNERMT